MMTDTESFQTTTPQALLACLKDLGIKAKTHSHPALLTVQDSQTMRGDIVGLHSKNLFLKDKKQHLWLIVCEESRTIDLKQLRKRIHAAGLSFASADLLWQILGVKPGSVTPFAIINDVDQRVRVVLDMDFIGAPAVNFHPLTNTQTTTVSGSDVLVFLRAFHHEPLVIDFNTPS
jgi:Ala-tRNA(Pro) deacylase